MQNLFQFLMVMLFGKRWIIFDLKMGYKATMVVNELEVALHEEKLANLTRAQEQMKSDLEKLLERPKYTEEEYLAQLPEDQKQSTKALYDIKKKMDGERAEEVTALRNRISQMNDDIASADGELNKGYMLTYKNRVKYDFIKNYKPKKSYGEKN